MLRDYKFYGILYLPSDIPLKISIDMFLGKRLSKLCTSGGKIEILVRQFVYKRPNKIGGVS